MPAEIDVLVGEEDMVGGDVPVGLGLGVDLFEGQGYCAKDFHDLVILHHSISVLNFNKFSLQRIPTQINHHIMRQPPKKRCQMLLIPCIGVFYFEYIWMHQFLQLEKALSALLNLLFIM